MNIAAPDREVVPGGSSYWSSLDWEVRQSIDAFIDAGFLRLMLGTLMNIIASRTAIPEHKTCFYVDEAAQLGFMPQLLEALTLMRSYGLQCTTYWQDLSQIQYHYPTGWQGIVNNSAVLQIFGIKNHWVARSLADIVGVEARQLLQMLPDEQLLVHEGKNIHTARRLYPRQHFRRHSHWYACQVFAGRVHAPYAF